METTNENQRPDPSGWLDSHGDYLYRYALARVGNKAVAEELLRETLLAAIGSCHNHAGRSAERTWLVGIMRHKAIDHLRHIARTAPFQLTTASDEGLDFFEDSGPQQGHWRDDQAPLSWSVDAANLRESREFWETFDRCLSRLPRQIAIAFTLREIDGLEANEICEILNVTPNNLCVMLHRGRTTLRNLLESEWFSHRAAAA